MKPAVFEYVQPQSLNEATALLREREGAKVIAGGQSLVPLMNFRLNRPELLIDLGRVGEMDEIVLQPGGLMIGSRVSHQQLAESTVIAEQLPVLARAAQHIGHWAIRNRGTLGGSLAHADPAAELPAALLALAGEVVVQSASGSRTIAAEELLLGYFTTSVAPDEIITAVYWPLPQSPLGFSEVMRRPGDFAVAGAFADIGAKSAVTWFGLGGRAQRLAIPQWPPGDNDRRALLVTLVNTLELEANEEYKRTIAVNVAMRAIKDAEGARV